MADYALGNLDAEHERLERQAARLEPVTERLFRETGIGSGQRVLDLGAGTGGVSMLLSRLVGRSGEVIGIERDRRTIARARSNAAARAVTNVRFVQGDVAQLDQAEQFDAVVGRLILCWLPDPASVLSQAARLARPGGVVAFQEPWQAPVLAMLAPLPLWYAAVALLHQTVRLSGGNPDIGADMYDMFEQAGLANPNVRQEILLGRDAEFARGIVDSLRSLGRRIDQLGLSADSLGDLDTMTGRLLAEVISRQAVGAASPAPISIWARKA